MDRVVAGRKLLAELVKGEQIEVRRVDIVARDLAQLVETLGRPPSGHELEDWLGEHAQVTELYASVSLLDELVYRHLTPPPPSEPAQVADARHPELERQLRDAPDRQAFLVYADWLQEHSDPLGELIALGVAATDGNEDDVTRFERHLKLHEARFLGGMKVQLADRIALRWRYGVVHAIDEVVMFASALAPKAWEQLLGLRVCGFVHSIALQRTCTPELDDAIGRCAAESLRALELAGCDGRLPEQLLRRELRSLTLGGRRIILGPETLPASLERLELRVQEIAPADEQPAALRLNVRELTAPAATFLIHAQLPRLERLALGLDSASASNLPDLLETIALPVLTHLAISDGVLDPETFAALAKLPIAGQLTSLALTNLELTDEVLQEIARKRGAFEALAELDLSFNEMTRDGLATARELAPNVISRRQHKRGNAAEKRIRRFAGSRLQVAETIAEPKAWKRAGVDGELRWARYRGEDEYELFVTADLQRYGCSCPSSIQPCKHVVALALVAERTTLPEASSEGIESRVSRRMELYDSVAE